MTVTIEEYAIEQLLNINRPTSVNNIMSMVIWAASENSQAKWNSWDTEEIEPGDSDYNSVGVKDYDSQAEGLAGFKATILNGKYTDILASLDANNVPAITCSYITNSPWGSQPTPQVVALVMADYSYYASKPVAGSTSTDLPEEDTDVTTKPAATIEVGEPVVETTPTVEAETIPDGGTTPAAPPDNEPEESATGAELNAPIVGGCAGKSGGYYAVGADGGVFALDGAEFYGSVRDRLNAPIVSMFLSGTGNGYTLLAADGGVFNFGDAAATPVVP